MRNNNTHWFVKRIFFIGAAVLTGFCGITGYAAKQYVVVNIAPGEVNRAVFEDVRQIASNTATNQVELGIGAIFSYLNQTRTQCTNHLQKFLNLSERYSIPVVVQLDGEQWWNARPDLWNWWDPKRPGYNPENRRNVEWTGWGPEHAIKIAWRNWGRQIRVLPPPNFMSPLYRKACHEEMRVLIPVIMKWWHALPKDKKHLFIGIKLGWESAIGVNSFYYPNGNALLDKPVTNDPQTGLKADRIPDRGVTAIGYAAVMTAGLATNGAIKEAHLAEIVNRHLTDICAVAADLGVPRGKLFTHVAGWKEKELLYDAALNRYSCPGWSFYKYAHDPGKDKGVQRVLKKSDAPCWAAVEWLLMGNHDARAWHTALDSTLSDPHCRYVCIFNWGGIKNNLAAITAIRELCSGQKQRGKEMRTTMPKTEMTIKELQCEYSINPLGIDTPQPRFSWTLESTGRGETQSAYQVLVARDPQKLAADNGDKWDSGKVPSGTSVHVVYEGKELTSGEQCWFKVRCWDKDGNVSDWSNPATFEMGLLTREAWQGEWIGAGKSDEGIVFVAGKFGQAVNLNGKSESIKIRHYPQLKPGKQISICAWIKPVEFSDNWRNIYRKEDGEARQLLAIGEDAGIKGIWFGLGINGAYTELGAPVSAENLMDGTWHFIAATYDGSAMTMYYDGKNIGSKPITGPIDTAGSQPACIGSCENRSEFFPGGIDDIRIYSRALSAQELQSMTEKNGGGDPALVGWWPLDGTLKNSIDGIDSRAVGGAISAPLLRREFEIAKKVTRARVYITGLGWYELFINGTKVGDHVLDPATTDYHKRVLYATYDITDYLLTGTNAVGVMLGNGWYCEPGRLKYGDSPTLMMQMHVEFADGTSTDIKTDRTWKTFGGPITHNDIYGGESYDARREQSGWTTAGYDDSGWIAAEIGEEPRGVLQSQVMPAIKIIQTIKPIKVTNPKPGVYVYDMGQLFGGWSRLHVRGPKGTKVTIKYAALMFEDSGLVDKRRHGESGETDYYILKGEGQEVYEPRFTYHPVRYVQIEGYPGTPGIDDLEGRVVHSAVTMAGNFECSNPLLNQIHSNVVWTLKNGLFGIPLDCLHREHWAWTDPATITGNLYPRKYMPLFWTKWLNDIADAQHENGGVPDVAPSYAFNQVDPAWGGNYPILVWYLYQYYGDKRIVKEHYNGMKKLVDYFASGADEYLVTEGHYGDHMLPGESPGMEKFISDETPPQLIWNGYFFRGALVVSRAARLLGKTGDAEKYEHLAENIKEAFNKKWLDTKMGVYTGGAQSANAFPLALDIVPAAKRVGVLKNIVDSITEKYDGHLHTGNTGTTCMIDTLPRLGYGDLMYHVVNQTTYPGWGFMVAQGATTIWESWSLVAGCGNSESMIMWATIDEFFYYDLAGISGPEYYGSVDSAPGFREIHIKPLVPEGLNYAKASILTVRGVVASEWKRDGKALILNVTLPVNSAGTVSIPKTGLKNITIIESGKQVWTNGIFTGGSEGIVSAADTGDHITFNVGSGTYNFGMKGDK